MKPLGLKFKEITMTITSVRPRSVFVFALLLLIISGEALAANQESPKNRPGLGVKAAGQTPKAKSKSRIKKKPPGKGQGTTPAETLPVDPNKGTQSPLDQSLDSLVEPQDQDSVGAKYILALLKQSRLNLYLKQDAEAKLWLLQDTALQQCLNAPCRTEISDLSAIRNEVNTGPTMRFLYSGHSGVFEGYTVGQHTVKVLNLLATQEVAYGLPEISERYQTTIPKLRDLFWLVLSLHDIGKHLSYIIKDKSRQLHYIKPIFETYLRAFNVSGIRKTLALELMNHDLLGNLLKNGGSPDPLVQEIFRKAKATGMSPKDFWTLQLLYFVCDAGAYPGLRANIMTTESVAPTTRGSGPVEKLILSRGARLIEAIESKLNPQKASDTQQQIE